MADERKRQGGASVAALFKKLLAAAGLALLLPTAYYAVRPGKLEQGRALTERYCSSCHNFNKGDTANKMDYVDTSKFSDEYLRERIVGNPSGNFPKSKKEQDLIIVWLRSRENKISKDSPK